MHHTSVLKKLLLTFALFLVVLTSIGYFYYGRWQRDVKQSATVPYILESAALVCNLESVGKQWNNFSATTIGRDFATLPLVANIQKNLECLSQAGFNRSLLDELSLIISIHGLSEEEIGYIFYLDIHTTTAISLLKFLEDQKRNNKYKVETRNYSGYTITTISQPTTKNSIKLHMLKQGSYMMISFSELLIEDIVRGLADKKPSAFLSLKKSSCKQGSLYINFPKLSSLLRVFVKQEYSCKLAAYLLNLAPAAQLALKLSNHYLLLTGLTNESVSSADSNYWVSTLNKIEPTLFSLSSYIPSNSSAVQYYSFKDAATFRNGMYSYQDRQHTFKAPITTDILASNDIDLLNTLFKNDIALCTVGSAMRDQLLFMGTNDSKRAISILEESQLITKPSEQQINQWSTIYTVNSTVFKSWLPHLIFSDFEPRLLAIVDNYIIFANNFSTLKQLQRSYAQGNTWANQQNGAHRFLASTLEYANFSMFANLQYAWPLMTQKLKPVWKALLDKHTANFQKFGYASFQLVNNPQSTQQPCYMNLLFAHMAERELAKDINADTISAVKYFQTAAPIISKPIFVTTHKKAALHLLVQDALSQLYFVDDMGRLIWKKRLEGPILTDISIIDLYKNNKCQYLFATSDAIHLIDYTGQEVSPYPQKLPRSGKGVGVNVIDYNQDKNYRILITDAKGNVFLRDMQYRPLPGWNPKPLHIPFAITPFHIRVDKDYFLSLQINGTLHALNRRGQSYAGFPIGIKESVYNQLIVQKGAYPTTTQLVILTEEGTLNCYNLKGTLQNSIQLEKTDYTVKFIISPALENSQSYAIFRQDLDKIAVLDEQGRLLFEKEYESERALVYQYFVYGEYKFYVITDPVKKRTYIYDTVGRLLNSTTIHNNGQQVALSFSEADQQILVYASFNKSILKYQLAIKEALEESNADLQADSDTSKTSLSEELEH
jgi:hypothetical protein